MLLTNYTSDLESAYDPALAKRLNEESIPFWTLNGKKYVNKFQTLIDAQDQPLDSIHFNLFDKVFYNYDWTQCPDSTGEELYLKRLLQLKEKYDYIRLGYSNGTDSQTIIDVAIKHNIHIDELVVMYQKDDIYIQKTEIDRIKNWINNNTDKLKNTKITYIEFNIEVFKFFLNHQLDICGSTQIISSPMSLDFYYKFGSIEVKKALWYPLERGLTHCNLLGKEPPIIDKIDDSYYWYLPDKLVSQHLNPWSEWFYTTKEMPELHAYQIHKNFQIMQKHNLDRNEYMFCTEEQWKEMILSTERYYHDGAYADKVRSGQRKHIMRISNYMHDNNFTTLLKQKIREYKNFKHIIYEFPRISPYNHYTPLYNIRVPGDRLLDIRPATPNRWKNVESRLTPEEASMYYGFENFWNDAVT